MPDSQTPCPPVSGICNHSQLQENPHVHFSRNQKIQVEEHNRKYTMENSGRECIAKIKVDNGLLTPDSEKRADYLLLRCEQDIAYFVELKGCDVAKACEQILSTITLLRSIVNTYRINARIVCSRVPAPDLRSSHRVRLENSCKGRNGTLIIRTIQYTELL